MASILLGPAEIVELLPVLVPKLAKFMAFGIGSIVCAELTRDSYHILCHNWHPLMKFHRLHHLAYKDDFSVVSEEIYRQSLWWHDVPEAFLMFFATVIYFCIVYWLV